MSLSVCLFGTADNDSDKRKKKAVRKTTQAGGSGTDLAKIATEQQAKLQKEKQERKAILKQNQAYQLAQASDSESELPELPVKPLFNPLVKSAAELIPKTSENPKDKPGTKPKHKPKAVTQGIMKESKKKESELEDESEVDEESEVEEELEVEEVPQKAENKYHGSGQAMDCTQQLESFSDEQLEEKNKRVRTGPLIPDTVIGMLSAKHQQVLSKYFNIL